MHGEEKKKEKKKKEKRKGKKNPLKCVFKARIVFILFQSV
jgi:hypothetical protein